MTKEEINILFAKICTYYTKFCEGFSVDRISMTQESWLEILEDIPLDVTLVALKKHVINTEKGNYVPTVSEIRKQAFEVCNYEKIKDAEKVWGNVIKSIQSGGWYQAENIIKGFDEITRKTVKSIGFRNICFSEESEIIFLRNQFIKTYNTFKNRKMEYNLMPVKMRNLLENNTNNIFFEKHIGGDILNDKMDKS